MLVLASSQNYQAHLVVFVSPQNASMFLGVVDWQVLAAVSTLLRYTRLLGRVVMGTTYQVCR